jgi:uncharacterized protein with von Willebrand factor type A (vWA) domain
VGALAGSAEVLRHRDVADLDPAEREQVRRLPPAFALRGETRRPARRGPVDPHRTVRELLRHGGEPALLRRHAPTERPGWVVLLVDVSGSMAPYADALLRFAHAAARGGRSEVFTIGTRLGELLRAFLHRWGRRGMARGAIVVVVSDGRELGDPERLGS